MTGLLLEFHNIRPAAGTLSAFPVLPALSTSGITTPLPFRAVLRVTSPVDWLATERD